MTNIRDYNGIYPKIHPSVWVDPTAVVIGNVDIGEDCSLWPQVVIRGDMHHIRIGERCSIQDGSVLHITHSSTFHPGGFALTLGNDVTVGHQAMLHGCTLGDRILVGMKAMVMDGAVVESDVIIAAGALVPPGKVLRSGYLYTGSPAREARPLSESESGYFLYTAANYVRLKDSYLRR